MKLKFVVLFACVVLGANMVKGQDNKKNDFTQTHKHEIRVSVSDGLTQGPSGVLGLGIADAITGSKRTNQTSSIVYGLGYRYAIGRFKVGGDVAFSQSKSDLTLAGDNSVSLKERDMNFLVLPTAEFVYFKRRLVELYGSASAGVNLVRHSETPKTDAGKIAAKKESFDPSFAYQVNPIAVRVGNDRVGGFVEAGIGHKGFLTAGVNVKF